MEGRIEGRKEGSPFSVLRGRNQREAALPWVLYLGPNTLRSQ